MLVAGATCVLLLLPILYAPSSHGPRNMRDVREARRCAGVDHYSTPVRCASTLGAIASRTTARRELPGLTVTAGGVCAAGRRPPLTPRVAQVVLGSVPALPRLRALNGCTEHVPGLGAAPLLLARRADGARRHGGAAGYGAARLMRALDVRSRPGPHRGNDTAAPTADEREHRAVSGEEQSSGAERHAGRIPRSLATGRLSTARAAMVVGFALLAAMNLEALRAPYWYRDFSGIPAIYNRLRDEPHAIVVEMPFYDRRAFFGNAEYMINATRHRHPIVNGYSGFAPPDFDVRAEALRAFPGDAALQMMHQLGVTHVVAQHPCHGATARGYRCHVRAWWPRGRHRHLPLRASLNP